MATYDLKYPGAAIDAILDTAYHLQQAGYIFRGSASDYSGTPTEREWVIAPAGFSGLGLSSAVPQGSIGVCLYNGTAWVGKVINVLTLDSEPTRNSQNGVTSGGVAATLDEIAGGIMETFASLLFDDETAAGDLSTKLSYAVKFSVSDVYQTVTHLNILAATTSKAGLMSAEDKAKVDSFLTNLRSLTFTDTTASADQGTKITETLKATIGGVQEVIDSITLLAATSSKAGLLSASDKAYIDALPAALTSLSNSISGALALMQSLVGYYVCDTATGTAAKTVAATGYSLTNGGCIRIKMTNANTADNATLNINSTGAKALYYDGAQASSSNTWEAGEVLEVYYDGTQYQCASGGGGKFATGEKVKEISLLDNLDNSGNLPKSSAIMEFLSPILVPGDEETVTPSNEITGVTINNGVWTSQSPRHIYMIPYNYTEGDKLKIVGNANNGSYFALLTSDVHTVGTAVPFCAEGTTGWTNVPANQESIVEIPSNCRYICINYYYNNASTNSFYPKELKLVQKDALYPFDEMFQQIEAELNTDRLLSSTWYQGSLGTNHGYFNDGTTTTRIISSAVTNGKMTVTVASGYYASIHEYSAIFSEATQVTGSSWLGNTHGWFTGTLQFDTLEACKTLVIILAKGENKNVAISPSEGSNVNLVCPTPIKENVQILDREIFGEANETIINNANADESNYQGYTVAGNLTRSNYVQKTDDYTGFTASVSVKAGSPVKYAIELRPSTNPLQTYYTTGWRTAGQSASVNNNTDSRASYVAIVATYVDGNTRQPTWQEFLTNADFEIVLVTASGLVGRVEALEEYHKDKGHPYYGQQLGSFTFGIEGAGSYPAVATPTQGMAIHGDYCVQGTSTESNSKTKAELIDMSSRTKIADLLLSHDGYSAIHCNMMCFGTETATGGIMPLLYASQWDGQTCCFVYDIKTSGATLMQVIDPSAITKDGVKFGVGYVDWLVDTDHGYIYALSYKASGYSGGQIITRFNLPSLSDGSTIQLTDDDIIGYNDLGSYIIRQDGCYNGGLLYLLFGSPNGYTDQLAIHVVSTFSMSEVTTLPMTFLTKEPEGLDFYKRDLLLHLINTSTIDKIIY